MAGTHCAWPVVKSWWRACAATHSGDRLKPPVASPVESCHLPRELVRCQRCHLQRELRVFRPFVYIRVPPDLTVRLDQARGKLSIVSSSSRSHRPYLTVSPNRVISERHRTFVYSFDRFSKSGSRFNFKANPACGSFPGCTEISIHLARKVLPFSVVVFPFVQ